MTRLSTLLTKNLNITQNPPNLYEQLDLPFDKQLALYACALGPASSGKLESRQGIDKAVDSAIRLLTTPER